MKRYKLDPEEQQILDELERGEWIPLPNQQQELVKLQASARYSSLRLQFKQHR